MCKQINAMCKPTVNLCNEYHIALRCEKYCCREILYLCKPTKPMCKPTDLNSKLNDIRHKKGCKAKEACHNLKS